MEKLFLKEPHYFEPNNNVRLVLENNILNRHMRTQDKVKNMILPNVYDLLDENEKKIIHFMYNSGEKMTTNKATKILNKGSTYCRKLLKKLANQNLLEWHGTSMTDSTQHYTLKF